MDAHADNGQYFKAGNDFAQLLYLGFGSYDDVMAMDLSKVKDAAYNWFVNKTHLPFDPVYVGELVTAFFAEFVYLNRLESLRDCVVDTEQAIAGAVSLLKDVIDGEEDDAWDKAI